MVNNDYTHWEMYAIGGSAAPTINSQGNRFLAPNDIFNKEVREAMHKIINEQNYIYVYQLQIDRVDRILSLAS